jgi:hypothetical protein
MVIDHSVDEPSAMYRRRFAWPLLPPVAGGADLSMFGKDGRRMGIKLYSERAAVDRVAIQAREGNWLGMRFDPAEVPYLGLWINEGRWPSLDDGLRHIALEPTNGSADQLDVARRLGGGTTLPGHSANKWRVSIVLGVEPTELAAFMTTDAS